MTKVDSIRKGLRAMLLVMHVIAIWALEMPVLICVQILAWLAMGMILVIGSAALFFCHVGGRLEEIFFPKACGDGRPC